MQDARIYKLAGIITGYSTGVKRGDIVLITASGEECQPLLKAVHRSCLERGARYVEIQFAFPEVARDLRLNLGAVLDADSLTPAQRLTITGTPQARASTTTIPNGS